MQSDSHPQISIFVTGARNTNLFPSETLIAGEKLGNTLAKKHITLMVAEAEGFPLWVSKGTQSNLGTVILFSPAAHRDEHARVYRLPHGDAGVNTIYTGFGRVGAELLGVRSADAVSVGCGEFAYIHAFTTALYEEKPIGILESDHELHPAVNEVLKNSQYKHDGIFFDSDPNRLVERIEAYVRKSQT